MTVRCAWETSLPDYVAYHDDEWGRAVRDDRGLFERLCLEGFQSGLSWLTILRKREAFRRAFAGFEPALVAAYGETDVERLMTDASIVRNRRKIEAVVGNARAVLELPAGLAELVWEYADPEAPAPRKRSDIPSRTPSSQALARKLKSHGFRFVGPTTAYALMQACGLVNDHLLDCPARPGSGPGPISRV
ncbi:DNA-3-methyladenine glycosylase I [Actinocorallia sp. B10E7]|uniref:DNA-3-methyladenine glycosylase I n=1 Tax=Actinocorallia sp. B10E7 TaxID=3153558 RepID=UPI00325CC467